MPRYLATYDVFYSQRSEDEYNFSWTGEHKKELKRFNAGNDAEARSLAKGKILERISHAYSGFGTNLSKLELKCISEIRRVMIGIL